MDAAWIFDGTVNVLIIAVALAIVLHGHGSK